MTVYSLNMSETWHNTFLICVFEWAWWAIKILLSTLDEDMFVFAVTLNQDLKPGSSKSKHVGKKKAQTNVIVRTFVSTILGCQTSGKFPKEWQCEPIAGSKLNRKRPMPSSCNVRHQKTQCRNKRHGCEDISAQSHITYGGFLKWGYP